MRTLAIIFIFFRIIFIGKSANILAIFPCAANSHYVMFERLLKRLAEVGHDVDVVTHFSSEELTPRYHELSLKGSLPIFTNNASVELIKGLSHYDTVQALTTILGIDICETIFNHRLIKMLKKTQKKYDLIINEIFMSDCSVSFGHFFKAPIVSLTTSKELPWAGYRIGNPDNPSHISNFFTLSYNEITFYQRLENTVFLWMAKFLHNYISSKPSNQAIANFFGDNFPSLDDIAVNTSLILVNTHFSIFGSRPTVPNFIEIGGLHISKPKLLSQYFENLLKTTTKGVICITMGSMFLSESFDYDKLQGMFDAFAELPYKVLWKASRKRFQKELKIPQNIHFEEWLPQLDILCHPNVKLLVSHGGLFGIQEATYCGVPRLGIPLFADQFSNVKTAEKMGLGITVEYDSINKSTIFTAAKNLLEDPLYKKNCESVARQFKDRPMAPLDTAVYWIEYVLRHKGAPEIRSIGADLSWFQYYLIDVAVVFLMICALFGFLVGVLLKILLRFAHERLI